jgi:hypothetical protein
MRRPVPIQERMEVGKVLAAVSVDGGERFLDRDVDGG